jgi:hypothetical protein
LRKLLIGQVDEVGEEIKVGFIGVIILSWLVQVRDQETTAGCAVEVDARSGCDKTQGVLEVKVGFDTGVCGSLIKQAAYLLSVRV